MRDKTMLDIRRVKQYSVSMFSIMILIILTMIIINSQVRAQVKLMGAMTHQYQIKADNCYQGWIRLVNTGHKIQRVKLYQTDYRFEADGHSYYEKPGTCNRSNAGWINLSQNIVRVPPGKKIRVYDEVNVPNQRDLTGTYWSMIMVEPLPIPGQSLMNNSTKPEEMLEVKQAFRYGLQIVTNVEQTNVTKIRIKNTELIYDSRHDQYRVEMELHNQGQYWIIPKVWIKLYQNKDSKEFGPFYGQQLRLYPKTSVTQKIVLKDLNPGSYSAILVVDNKDDVNVFARNYVFKIK